MEDGVKGELAQHKEPKFLAKAGWMKKGQGKLLASYKDRYIHIEKTELVVYENEDLQNCLERIDLENYDKCHELKSPFKKKHRLILIRSPKSGNKIHDVKFQAQNSEEKEAWINAFSDGIGRAKNKVFDEVKVDDSSNLEHVTRTRPKGNRNRRPPTRIHMKEVANVSSDGILRLDLDLEDAVMPNGTHHLNDGTETPQTSTTVPIPASNTSQAEEEAHSEPAGSPQKKVIKPPMPPTKEAKRHSSPEDERDKNDGPEKQILQPPMPPSKDSKPHASPVEEATEQTKPEMSPDSRKKTGPPPPTPPNKPSSCKAEYSQSSPKTQPPVLPSKDKKESHVSMETDQQAQGSDEGEEKEEDTRKESNATDEEPDEVDQSVSVEENVSEEESRDSVNKRASKNDPQIPTEPLIKSPVLTSKNNPEEPLNPDSHTENSPTISEPNEEPDSTVSDTSASSLLEEEAPCISEVLSVDVSLNDPSTDTLSLSPQLCPKKKKAEEKSVDSGQHSDDESEVSGSEDALVASTVAHRASHAAVDVLDTSENESQVSINLRPAQALPKPMVRPMILPYQCSERTSPLKPSTKGRSASIGNLLTAPEDPIQVKEPSRAGAENLKAPNDDVMKLATEVALEMENTSELLSRVSQAHRGDAGESLPEDLLAKAMEKLKRAEHVLREVKKLKLADNSRNRKSW